MSSAQTDELADAEDGSTVWIRNVFQRNGEGVVHHFAHAIKVFRVEWASTLGLTRARLDGGHESGVKPVVGIEQARRVAAEEKLAVDKGEDDVASDFAEVHAAYELFERLFARIDAFAVLTRKLIRSVRASAGTKNRTYDFVVVGREGQHSAVIVKRSPFP